MTSTPPNLEPNSQTPHRLRNFLIALAAILLSVALFVGLRTESTATDISQMAEEAVPLEIALNNGKPTMMEFYANWCTSCRAMAPEIKQLETQYQDKINFVMLNVDNTKWLPELTKYRVDGIPHFVFLNRQGEAIGETIGEVPQNILAENLQALQAGNTLPNAKIIGQQSTFQTPTVPTKNSKTDPRSHSSQTIN